MLRGIDNAVRSHPSGRRLADELAFVKMFYLRRWSPRLVKGLDTFWYLGTTPWILEETLRAQTAGSDAPMQARIATVTVMGRDHAWVMLQGAKPYQRARRSLLRGWLGRPESAADLELIEIPSGLAAWWATRGAFIIPRFVSQYVELSGPPRTVIRSRRAKERINQIINLGYRYDVVSDARSHDDFYRRFYAPTVERRYGARAHLRGYHYVRRACQRSTLLMISRQGRRVAGALVWSDESPHAHLWFTGVANGGYAQLANAATHYLCMLWAYEANYRRLYLGTARPTLTDGLLRFRRRWGANVTRSDLYPTVLALRINRWTPAVAAFLQRNVPVVHDGHGLAGLGAWDGEDPVALQELWNPGLRHLWIAVDTGELPAGQRAQMSALPLGPNDGPERLCALAVGCGS